MSYSYESLINRNYKQKLDNERKTKGLFNTVYIPKHLNSIKILPISNLFYGNKEAPPRLALLGEHIKYINDLEEGAFFLGGNLFYYPPGVTEEKEALANRYIDDLSTILEKANRDKILLAYDGINELKFKDDRKLKNPIETMKTLAENLGIAEKYYADTKVELDFVFNNQLTNYKSLFMYGLFTSLRPISETKNAIINKIKANFLLNGEKTFVIDTSSSQLVSKKKVLTVSDKPLISKHVDAYWLSVAGYTDQPQIVKKNNRYTVNQKLIELKIEKKNFALHQQSSRKINTVKENEWNQVLQLLTIGVDYEKYFDPDLFKEINTVLIKGAYIEEELSKIIKDKISKIVQNEQKELISELDKVTPPQVEGVERIDTKKTKEKEGFRFE